MSDGSLNQLPSDSSTDGDGTSRHLQSNEIAHQRDLKLHMMKLDCSHRAPSAPSHEQPEWLEISGTTRHDTANVKPVDHRWQAPAELARRRSKLSRARSVSARPVQHQQLTALHVHTAATEV